MEELRLGLMALKAGDADAYYYTSDAMVTSQAQFINDTARAKKLPTMGYEQSLVAQGALVSYGVNYYEVGRLSSKYVHRVLTGTNPRDLPVESLSRVGLAVNLKTAQELGLMIPQAVLMSADVVIRAGACFSQGSLDVVVSMYSGFVAAFYPFIYRGRDWRSSATWTGGRRRAPAP